MKLAVSNIAWSPEKNTLIYTLMRDLGFCGLEIAPTKLFPTTPYDSIALARIWIEQLKKEYGLMVPSMQSIWYGRKESVFGKTEERKILADYTRKAIDFAVAIGCKNLVFGCPHNRNLPDGADETLAIPFFRELGEYAFSQGTVIGLEANPAIYHTNYINNTRDAFRLIRQVNSKGFRLNLDAGTMIQNGEDVSELAGNVFLINHVHISEPSLKPIEERHLHKELMRVLSAEGYQGFVSIEMGIMDDIVEIEEKMSYIRGIFG